MNPIKKPSKRIVESYVKKYWALDKDKSRALKLLFTKLGPKNNDLSSVLLKATVLNNYASTNIIDISPVAKRIYELDIDKDLNSGKGDLVNEIALTEIGGEIWNFYSFATKYYSFHWPKVYPIYDKFVDKMLWHFRNKDQFTEFKRIELKTYKRFSKIIKEFRRFYRLTDFSLRELDHYFWIAGKEHFSKKRY